MKILAAKDLMCTRDAINSTFAPGIILLLIIIILGHFIAYKSLAQLNLGWNPLYIPSYTGIIYIIFLICSVIAHEIGHLVADIHIGDQSAEMHIQYNSLIPIFITKHCYKCILLLQEVPILFLSGIFMQLLFGSIIGIILYFINDSMSSATVLLIDMAALSSLTPIFGTDGYRFLVGLLEINHDSNNYKFGTGRNKNHDLGATQINAIRIYSSTGLNKNVVFISTSINIIYLLCSLILFIAVTDQWVFGIYEKFTINKNIFIEIPLYLTLFLPVVQYLYWALKVTSFTLRHLRIALDNS